MANRKQRRHPAKPQGFTFADQLQRQRMIKELAGNVAKDKMVKVQTEIQVQQQMWLSFLALNDVFGFGADRIEKFAEGVKERSEWYMELVKGGDEEYADEKLRQEAERVLQTKVKYAYEDEREAANKAKLWEPANLYERIRMMTVDEMARFIPEKLLGLQGAMLELAESRWKRELRGK